MTGHLTLALLSIHGGKWVHTFIHEKAMDIDIEIIVNFYTHHCEFL